MGDPNDTMTDINANKIRPVAQTNHLPFDRLRANGGMLKPFNFSAHAELVEA